MPGKSLTHEQIADAVSLRAAGYTVAAIAQRLHIGVRTLNRVFERHGSKKGEVKAELIEAAKRHLIEGVTSNERVKEEAARIVADDLAHARLLRERMADATEHLTARNLEEAVLLMRAAAAYSTALKNTSDMLHHTLRTDRTLDADEAESLPELIVLEMTADDIRQIRDHQAEDVSHVLGIQAVPIASEEHQMDDDVIEEGAMMAWHNHGTMSAESKS